MKLAFSPNGLLLAWADFGSRLQYSPPDDLLVQAASCVRLCELATGRCAMIYRQPEAGFTWRPCPRTPRNIISNEGHPMHLSWAPAGNALCICSPWLREAEPARPVYRVCLLP